MNFDLIFPNIGSLLTHHKEVQGRKWNQEVPNPLFIEAVEFRGPIRRGQGKPSVRRTGRM